MAVPILIAAKTIEEDANDSTKSFAILLGKQTPPPHSPLREPAPNKGAGPEKYFNACRPYTAKSIHKCHDHAIC